MIYRRKTYIVASAVVEEFNALFNEILLPAQQKYGARLIGRWHAPVDEETSEIFAVWEYDTMDQYEEIERSIKADAEHLRGCKNVTPELERTGSRQDCVSPSSNNFSSRPLREAEPS